jgi:glucosamine--fructose-6-phosphate aminotransferase (isomerizing)
MTQEREVRRQHPYFMYDAIQRQPQAMEEMLRKHATRAQEVAAEIAGKRRLYLVGIGTSWHAALVAQHWLRRFVGRSAEVQAWQSFEFCSYPPPLNEEDAVIVISHRGTKTYSFQALEMAKASAAYTVSITSTDPGQRIRVADAVLHTVERERSASFTISYTAALTVLALLTTALGSWKDGGEELPLLRAQLEEMPQKMTQVLTLQSVVQQAARRFRSRKRFISVGWGPNTANAYEAALKMKETSATDSEGIQVEQLLHGPFCSVDQNCLVTLIAPPGPGYERAMNIARASLEVGAPVWALVQAGDVLLSDLATESCKLPPVPEFWSPLVYVMPLQLFTYYLALARGAHPDLFQRDNVRQAAARRQYDL